MSKPISIGQSHNVISVLANNVDWNALDGDDLQRRVIDNPREAGAQFTAFLRNGGRVIVGEPKIIPIDRTTPFKPSKFIGNGWTIEEEDERSLALTQVDLTAVRPESVLKDGESVVNGEEKLKRLKAEKHIRLDAKVFQTLRDNKHLIPERWKEKTNGNTTYICFDGTVLRSPGGDRYVLYLCWRGDEWSWSYVWLGIDFNASSLSAVLAS